MKKEAKFLQCYIILRLQFQYVISVWLAPTFSINCFYVLSKKIKQREDKRIKVAKRKTNEKTNTNAEGMDLRKPRILSSWHV